MDQREGAEGYSQVWLNHRWERSYMRIGSASCCGAGYF